MAQAGKRRARVMVVDDDASLRELIGLHLRNAGYAVLAAEDAVEAGRMVLQRAPDLIICDVDMPYLDGYEFVAALRGDPATASIPVVFLTVKEDVADRAAKLGAVACLVKPLLADRLLEIVARFVR